MNARTPIYRERSIAPTGTLPKPRVVPQSTGLASGEPERCLTTDRLKLACGSHAAGSASSDGSGTQAERLAELVQKHLPNARKIVAQEVASGAWQCWAGNEFRLEQLAKSFANADARAEMARERPRAPNAEVRSDIYSALIGGAAR